MRVSRLYQQGEVFYPKPGDPIPTVVSDKLDELRRGGADKTSACIGSACFVYNLKYPLKFDGTRFPEDRTVYGNSEFADFYKKLGLNRTTEPVENSLVQFTVQKPDPKKGGKLIDYPVHAGVVKKVNDDGTIEVLHTGSGETWKLGKYKRDPETGKIYRVGRAGESYTGHQNLYFYTKDKVPESIHKHLIKDSGVKYSIDSSNLEATDEGKKFIEALQNPKNILNVRQLTGMSLEDYDRFAKYAIATAQEETELGKGLLYRSGVDDLGSSRGLIQFNWNLHVNSKNKDGSYVNEQLRKKLNYLGINESNYTDPDKQALLFMVFAPLNERYAKSFYKKGNKKDPKKDTITRQEPLDVLRRLPPFLGPLPGLLPPVPKNFVTDKFERALGLTKKVTRPISGNNPDLTKGHLFRYGYKNPRDLFGNAEGENPGVKRFVEMLGKISTSVDEMPTAEYFRKLLQEQRNREQDEEDWNNALNRKKGGDVDLTKVKVLKNNDAKIGFSKGSPFLKAESLIIAFPKKNRSSKKGLNSITMKNTPVDLKLTPLKKTGGSYKVSGASINAKAFDTKPKMFKDADAVLETKQKARFRTGGNFLVLDHEGNAQMKIEGGEIVFSRIHTQKILDTALENNDLELGRLIVQIRDIHKKTPKEYVKE